MKTRAWTMAVVALGIAVTAALLPGTPAHAFAIYVVRNTNDSGNDSLRWAIDNANGTAGLDSIFFNIAGAGPHVITPLTDLPDITDRFIAHQREAIALVRTFEDRDVAHTIMVSPFVAFITYSVLDGCRLIVTHERRHFEQARRVTQAPAFPSRSGA